MTEAPREPLDVLVVPHTHWDREWYHPAGRFRQRLVALVDELLDDPAIASGSFLLDGQAAILDDYLAIRPERRDALSSELASGRIEAGPWYVLADELLPSGEALIRNLLAGRRALAALGAEAPPVLYSPDAFGHAAALPALAEGFGFGVAIVWRGYGGARWPGGDAAWWRAPNGARVLLHHLPPDGYEFGSSMPADSRAASARWRAMHDVLAPRARLRLVLIQNGADHHARQRGWREAIDALRAAAEPHRVRHASLREFALLATARADDAMLPDVSGELRDSYGYTWTLQGTFASRAAQKRRNANVQRRLERDVEPWVALVAARDGTNDGTRALLHAAWRTLLLCHPHDTLCGCSSDEVARAADARFDDAASQASGLSADAIAAIVRHDRDAARERRSDWQSCVLVRNRAPRSRGGVAEVEIDTFVRDVAVGPGSAGAWQPIASLGATPIVRDGSVAIPLQLLDRTLRHDRTEAPRHYPDDDIVETARAVLWVPPQDGYSVRGHSLGTGDATAESSGPACPVCVDAGTIDNGIVSVSVSALGEIAVRVPALGVVIPAAVRFEDVGDAGDLYTHSAVGEPLTAASHVDTGIVHRGPLRGTIEVRYRLRVPSSLQRASAEDPFSRPAARADDHVELPITLRLTLDADAPFVRIDVAGENVARDHRLRIVFATRRSASSVLADAALGPVARHASNVPPDDRSAERPVDTASLHRWVSLSDGTLAATLFSDGLAEYEAASSGDVAITLVRAVGELSRPDLPERPGHAGWPVSTPEAQMRGPFEARLAIAFHDAQSADMLDTIERLADDVLLPLVGETLRSALTLPAPAGGVELHGAGLALGAIKPSDDGRWTVLRCVNVTRHEVRGAWRVKLPLREAVRSRLDETGGDALPIDTNDSWSFVPIVVGPRGVSTVLVR